MIKKIVTKAKSENTDKEATKDKNRPIALPLEKKFKLIREQIQHEDGLIHQRLSWLLLSQAFLFAAFTTFITTDKPFNFLNPNIQPWVLPFGICVTGFLLNLSSFFGLRAAYKSLKYLRENWYQVNPKEEEQRSFYKSFPQITWVGGRLTKAIMTASSIPSIVSAIWFLLASAVTPNHAIMWCSIIIGTFTSIVMFIETFRN